MGYSSLIGTEHAELQPSGRDTPVLGPGDSSDSGSDVAGIEELLDGGDPTEPVDVALRPERQRSAVPLDTLTGGPSDAAGTGERRSAGSDAGRREAPDISVDRVFGLNDEDTLEEPGAAQEGLAEVDRSQAPDPVTGEDESADPVGDGHSDAELAKKEKVPGRTAARRRS